MTTAPRLTEQDLLQTIERLRPVVEHYRDQGEQERRIRVEVIDAMKSEGLFRLKLPREYGGDEVELTPFIKAVEALAAIDSAAGWTLANMGTSAVIASLLPAAGAEALFGEETLNVGVVAPRGKAIPVEGGYRVSGRWPLASGSHHAQWFAGCCLVFEGEAPRMNEHGPDLQLMAFPASDVTILDTWHSTGMRATDSTDYAVQDVFVPAERCFGVFTTPSRLPGRIYQLRIDAHFFTALASVGLGVARSAIDAFVELARQKTPTLSQTGLATRPTVHAAVARAEARLQSAAAYLHEVTREIDSVLASGGMVSPDLEARRRLACVTVAEASEEVVDSMFRLAGSSAIYEGSVFDRCLRDIHTLNQHVAVSPVWWEKTGQFYFGQPLGMP